MRVYERSSALGVERPADSTKSRLSRQCEEIGRYLDCDGWAGEVRGPCDGYVKKLGTGWVVVGRCMQVPGQFGYSRSRVDSKESMEYCTEYELRGLRAVPAEVPVKQIPVARSPRLALVYQRPMRGVK
jgi:hypothetical protein